MTDLWCIWWFLSSSSSQWWCIEYLWGYESNMHDSFSNIIIWEHKMEDERRLHDGNKCLLMFRVGCRSFMRFVCFILRAGPVLRSDERRLWLSGGVHACPVGHLDGFFQASPDYSRQLSVIVKPALIVWRVLSIRSRFVVWSGVFISCTSRVLMRDSLCWCCIAVYRRDERGMAPLLDAAEVGPVMEVMSEML